MKKKLEDLIKALDEYKLYGSKTVWVNSIIDDSRKLSKGCLFIAIKGLNFDAHRFISKAIFSGASVIVGEEEPKKSWLNKISYIKVPSSRRALGLLASSWYGFPSRKLKVIGVTGTDGKTTTGHLIGEILNRAGEKTGVISTVETRIGKKVYETGLHVTNPEPLVLQSFLAKMVDEKCKYAVLEVTSHGLDQERTAGVNFDIAVLTNITHEHLDYHKTWNEYFKAKAKLFKITKNVVLNKDDASFDKIRPIVQKSSRLISYSIKDKKSDLFAGDIKELPGGYEFIINFRRDSFKVKTKLQGLYNVSNILAAVAVAKHYRISNGKITAALKTFRKIKGRLDEIENKKNIQIFIDFAHTPNSLKKTLNLLKKRTEGRVISVLGSAGERDVEKRYLMGQISAKIADFSVFTAEDPRSENVHKIINEMVEGAKKAKAKEIKIDGNKDLNKKAFGKYFIRIPERGEAIAYAIQKLVQPGDAMVICGKGHEKSMCYDSVEHPWSDHLVVKNVLRARKDIGAIVMAAGKGKRMKSPLPKVLHRIAGRPMIAYTLENLREALIKDIVVVVGYKGDDVLESVVGSCLIAYQKPPLGTGDASLKGLEVLKNDFSDILVVNGDDSAFYSPKTIKAFIEKHKKEKSKLTLATIFKKKPGKIGVVVPDGKGNILGIHHWGGKGKPPQKGEINCGLYLFEKNWLEKNITKIPKRKIGEYYLTDLVEFAVKQKVKIQAIRIPKDEWVGVNTQQELVEADKKKRELLKKFFNEQ